MSTCAVVPLKGVDIGKRRLSGVLPAMERARLIRTMSNHVLEVLWSVREIANVFVVTGDAGLVPARCRHIQDPGAGLNGAVTHAAHIVQSLGAQAMLVVAADLPFLAEDDIHCMLEEGRRHPFVLAADSRDDGTNAMLLTPPSRLAPCYGPHSLRVHLQIALQLGLSASVVRRTGLAQDIDEPDDLAYLLHGTARQLVG